LVNSYIERLRVAPILKANGPAIKGGCVTRRKHRAESWYFSREAVTVQGGYGALFAVMVQVLLSITRVAVQVLLRAGYKSRYTEFYIKYWRGRGTGIQDLSWAQDQIAKNVTNLLILLSVLAVRGTFWSGYRISIVVIKSWYLKVMVVNDQLVICLEVIKVKVLKL
jgi:hypothetical protein